MSLVAFEEQRVLALRRDLVDFTVVAGRNIQISGLIESEIPDVFRAGCKVFGGTPGRVQSGLGRIFWSIVRWLVLGLGGRVLSRFVLDLVDLAIGSGRGVNQASGSHSERLHLQFLRLEDDGRFAVGSNPIYAGRRPRCSIDVSRVIGGKGPYVGRGRRVKQLERRREFETAGAADGHSACGALDQLIQLRLLPSARAFGSGRQVSGGDCKRK